MTNEQIFTNARIVTRDSVIEGTLAIRDGLIAGVDDRGTGVPGAVDFGGDYLIPGLIELHTDNIEKNFAPRPGVEWPALSAALAHDAQIVAAGITTVFDALRAGDVMEDQYEFDTLAAIAAAIAEAQARGLTRAEHWFHIRCEVSCPGVLDHFAPYRDHPLLKIMSVMDHAPGQRQFTDLEMYRRYYGKKYNLANDALDVIWQRQIENSERHSAENRRTIVDFSRARGLALASHDDATEDHIAEAVRDGVVIAEFPTTEEAAAAATREGLSVLAGGPNIVRGGSHSGNVSAGSLVEKGILGIISSDYVPSSMLDAVFKLHHDSEDKGDGIALPDALAMVSANPADAAGLHDRGRIAPGLRADIVRVRAAPDLAAVRTVWRGGERVF
jgi:alpha-D-ribose 1-methylphosphonate 5-triphosphate diphosphatase